jgi:hypothetical protein
VPRPSPFADLAEGPSAAAVTVELGRPSRAAFGCFGSTTAFLAVVAAAAIGCAVVGPASFSTALRWVAAVLGVLFLALAAALVLVAVRAGRVRQGLALDAEAVWWRSDAVLVRLPWSELAAARMVEPVRIRGLRTSTPRVPALQLAPPDEDTVRRHPDLLGAVTAGEPLRPELPTLRFTFQPSSAEDAAAIAAALTRFAPDKLA